MRATHLLIPGHIEPDGGGRYDRYRLRVSAIGNPEGRGVGRLKWEKEYYGDVLNRIGKTLWLREYDL